MAFRAAHDGKAAEMEMAKTIEEVLRDARAEARAGDQRKAERLYGDAASLARGQAEPILLAHALRHLSDLARERGAGDEALAAAEEAVALYRSAPSRSLDLANALRLAALAREALNERGQAVTLWREARLLYDRCDVQAGVAECDRHLTE
jgi:tetratricopeptide (TPR) repeat protein